MHIRMYGERFDIVSDPFDEGDGVAVHATSARNPVVRTLRLPTAILVSISEAANLTRQSSHRFGWVDEPLLTCQIGNGRSYAATGVRIASM
jgi:hypothetical protein